MSKKTYLYRYLQIIKKVRNQPYASFEDISGYVESELYLLGEEKESFSKRTFQRDLADIRRIFNIEIVFDRMAKGYYIYSDENNNAFDKMIETFDIFQSMVQTDSLKNYFHFDHNRPAGTQFLRLIIDAVKNRRKICFTYIKNWNQRSERIAMPLVLKEYKGRWYVFCILKNEQDVKTFALDRIESLYETGEKYSFPPDWDAEKYFEHCFGIYRPASSDEKPQEVFFETDMGTANYLFSQPLHKSQEAVLQSENFYRFRIKVFITYDLEMELLSMGSKIKIISPEKLRSNIKTALQKSLKQYI